MKITIMMKHRPDFSNLDILLANRGQISPRLNLKSVLISLRKNIIVLSEEPRTVQDMVLAYRL